MSDPYSTALDQLRRVATLEADQRLLSRLQQIQTYHVELTFERFRMVLQAMIDELQRIPQLGEDYP